MMGVGRLMGRGAASGGGGGGGGSITPLLDGRTTGLTLALSAWQQLLTAYAGAGSRWRESGGDTEVDIGFGENFALDEAAIASHKAGNSVFCTKLYDQSGAAHDMQQTTANAQPGYATAGGQSRPALVFDGSNDFLINISGTPQTGDIIANNSGYIVAAVIVDSIGTNATDPYDNDSIFCDNGPYFGLNLKSSGGFYPHNYDGSFDAPTPVAVSLGAVSVVEWRHEGGNLYARVNGAGETVVASGNTAVLSGGCAIGREASGTQFAHFHLLDLIAFNTVPSGTVRDAIVADLIARLT